MALVDRRELDLLADALEVLNEGFEDLPEVSEHLDTAAVAAVLREAALKMRDNYPYHHPRYAGQMLKPPHPVARLAYALALWLNPNNHALDGGRASSAMEKECVARIGEMLGVAEPLGHLCGGGTMANLEALWAAGRLAPGPIVASSQAHYTHRRLAEVLRLDFEPVPADAQGRMDLDALEARLAGGGVGTVVATLGTTGLGAVDPLADVLALRERYGFRVHVDAAYGGWFRIASSLAPEVARHFACVAEADSIVIDPHKHGLQPYGCGCVLFRDPAAGALYRHDSPYTYFSSAELHLGEISLECSRPGAAAVALWATQKLFPPVPGGAFAGRLDRSLAAARALWRRLAADARFFTLAEPELDIVVFGIAAPDAEAAGLEARALFERAAAHDLHLALIDLPAEMLAARCPAMTRNSETVTCLRSVLMKPEHLDAIPDIVSILDSAL